MIRKGGIFIGILLLFVLAISTSVFATEVYQFEQMWPEAFFSFRSPYGVAVDTSGNVYVADTSNNRIQKFDSSGTTIIQWGSYGNGNGQLSSPSAITTDTSGNVYVADSGNSRIQKFDSNGTYITKWGSSGSGNSQFSNPFGIAIDAAGNVYVVDGNNHRVQKFDSNGSYITQWGSSGTGNGQFSFPRGIAIDISGNIYIADANNNRIQKFSSSGTYITQWGSYGTGNAQFNFPSGIRIDSAGNIYISEAGNHRIQKFDSNGNFITKWGSAGNGNGQFSYPYGLAIDTSGIVYVADENNNRIQMFDSSGVFIAKWSSPPGSDDGQFSSPAGLTVNTLGHVYVADYNNNRIQKFDSNGNLITKWGSFGKEAGQFCGPFGITTNASGYVYVVDSCNHRIQKFDSNGIYLTQWGTRGSGNGQFDYPESITIDTAGNIYVLENNNNRIQKFDSNGNFITQWGSYGTGDGYFCAPYGLSADASGNVYVADNCNNRVQKFDSNGKFITKWGSQGTGDGQFSYLWGVTTDASGDVYVTDLYNNRIQKFDSNGNFLTQWGSYGTMSGQFFNPSGITVDASGKVYVAEFSNHRVQIFSRLQYPLSVSKPGTGSGLVSATGISCGNDCIEKYDPDTVITLTAVPDTGSIFTGWSGGGCSGTGTCTITMTADKTITASFVSQHSLSISKSGTGSGVVNATGINCGSDCLEVYNSGTVVTLTAAAEQNSVFDGWSSGTGSTAPCTGTGNCSFNINADSTLNAVFALKTYAATPSAGTGGSISPNTPQAVTHGSTAAFIVTPLTGYHINTVSGCGGTLSGNTFTTGPVTSDCTVSALFAINTYTVAPSAGANGSINPNTAQIVNYGSTASFTVTPNTGYHVDSVSGCGGTFSGNAYTTGAVTADCTVTASFAINTYAITVSAGTNGSITPISATVNHGGSQTFSINPNIGYHIADVLIDGSSAGAVSTYTFSNVTAPHNISATFAVNTYTITAGSNANGIVTCSPTTVNYGMSSICSITPNIGYHVSDVLVDGTSSGPKADYTFANVIANHSISAIFAINSYIVTPTTGANGGISPNTSQTINHGSTAIFTVTPNTGYHIDSVTGCGGTLSGNTYITSQIAADCPVKATFAINTYKVITTAGPNGSISCTPTTVDHGSGSNCTITPDTGHHITDVAISGVSVGAVSSYLINNITTDTSILASFAINTYAITANAGSNGNVSPTSSTVNYGGSQTIIITPDTGYHIDDVKVDGISVGAVSSYTFTDVTAPHNISATFAINTYTVTLSAGVNGVISPDAPQTVNHGSSAIFSVNPNTGYHIYSVSGCGGTLNSNTFMTGPVTADCTVTASFAINTYTVTPSVGANGTISPATTQTINHGATASFVITPDIGHYIVSVTGCGGTLTGNTYSTGPVTTDCTVSAAFAINTYLITANTGTNGTITPSSATVNYGGGQIFAITPDTGYHVANVSIDGISIGTPGSFSFSNVTAPHMIIATFEINTYTVIATAGANGSISCSPSMVNYGSDSACTITLETGYHIADVTVNGISVGAVDIYTIPNITADTTIAASFAINTYEVTTSAGPNGAISCTANPVNYGSDTTCTITPAEGYHTVNVMVDGATTGASKTYTFNNVTTTHTIAATFDDNHDKSKLKVKVEDKGRGTVTSSDGTINCNGKDKHGDDDDCCKYFYYENTVVVLTAEATEKSVFTGWEGCDSSDGNRCIVTVDKNTKVEAHFESLDPEIEVHPDSLNFGSVKLGKQESRKVKIKNKGDAALVISDVKVTGSTEFSVNWSGQKTLAHKDSLTFDVIFAPKSKGEKAATLRITSNDLDEAIIELPMNGKGNPK